MLLHAIFLVITCVGAGITKPVNSDYDYDFAFVSREEWTARAPTYVTPLDTPVPFVIIHHSYEPGACYTNSSCVTAMKSMQDYHQIDQGWADIGYNFAVGSDGVVYEGRGWTAVGAHAAGSNTVSIGIVLIGNWISELPPKEQLLSAQQLISAGLELGYIHPGYKLIGHRQVRPTECPGDRLFRELANWDHFDGLYENIQKRVH